MKLKISHPVHGITVIEAQNILAHESKSGSLRATLIHEDGRLDEASWPKGQWDWYKIEGNDD